MDNRSNSNSQSGRKVIPVSGQNVAIGRDVARRIKRGDKATDIGKDAASAIKFNNRNVVVKVKTIT